MNIATIITVIILIAAVGFAIKKIIKDKKNGKHGCSFYNCDSCEKRGLCKNREISNNK